MTGKNCSEHSFKRSLTQPWKLFLFGLAVAPMTFVMTGCDVDVEDPGEAPSVDVDPGEAPDVDVTPADVDVGTEEKTIEVPDVDVDVPEENEQ